MRRRVVVALAALTASAGRAGPMLGQSGTNPAPASHVAQEIAAVEARIDSALASRDQAALGRLVADSFTWIHGADGRVDSRETWLRQAAVGMALTRQSRERSAFDTTLVVHGGHTAVRTSRLRLRSRDGARESWLRQRLVFVRRPHGWRLASGQGTLLYDGPPTDTALYSRYAGRYVIAPGRVLLMEWDGDALMATLPSGARAPIFLASPTEEAARSASAGRLRFTLGPDGRPVTAALVRDTMVLWRAERADR